jgi:hypothetical protein
MAGPVDEQHFSAALEHWPERRHLIAQIAAGAVNEHKWQAGLRRRAAAHGRRGGIAADIDHFADGRKQCFSISLALALLQIARPAARTMMDGRMTQHGGSNSR